MTNLLTKALSTVRLRSPFISLIESGVSPDEIREAVVELLTPYFEHKEMLEEHALTVLAPEAVNVLKLEDDKWGQNALVKVLAVYRGAVAVDGPKCLKICADASDQILHAVSEFVSMFYMESDKSELPLEELKYEMFKMIGGIIEACMQPFLRLLLTLNRIKRGKPNPTHGVESMSLGNVVGELYDTLGGPELFAPSPWKVRLNQWRNIAQHHSSRIENGKIVGRYGDKPNEHEVILTQAELIEVFLRLQTLLGALRGAHTIFVIDNLSALSPFMGDVKPRRDALIFELACSFSTQGFELIDFKIESNKVAASLKDVSSGPLEKRVSHCSQFVYVIWCQFPTDEVTVTYLDKEGLERFLINVAGADCQAVKNDEISFIDLADRVNVLPVVRQGA